MIITLSLLTIFLACVASYFNWNRNRAVLLFAGFIISYSLKILTHQAVVNQGNELLLAILYNHSSPLYFLTGPLLYLFVRSMVDDQMKFTSFDLIHLGPAVLILLDIVPYLFSPFEHKLEIARAVIADLDALGEVHPYSLVPVHLKTLIRPVLLIGYSVASVHLLFSKNLPDLSKPAGRRVLPLLPKQYRQTRRWLLFVISNVLFTSISYHVALFYFMAYGYEAASSTVKMWERVAATLYVLMPVSLLLYPNLMYGFIRIGRDGNERALSVAEDGEKAALGSEAEMADGMDRKDEMNLERGFNAPATKATTSATFGALDSATQGHPSYDPIPDELFVLKNAILTYFETEKPYLKKDFKIHDLAVYLNKPAHHISYCFSICFDENFSQLKKRYRIDYAIRLMQEGAAEEMTIEGLGQQAGFASKSSFFTAFKEATGRTPQLFLSQMRLDAVSIA